jgi:biopolymer transport protein ExbD
MRAETTQVVRFRGGERTHRSPEERMSRHRPIPRFEVSSEINVTPMIDVMLVLLIIFMVVTPAAVAALPAAATARAEREQRVTLTLAADGRLSVDAGHHSEPVAAAALEARLRSLYAARPNDHVLYLKADRDASYSQVLSVLDAARRAGVRRIGAITAPPPQPRH